MFNGPTRVRLRMYQVGFGDCFLLTFEYAQPSGGLKARHILIDFGTFELAEGIGMRDIAELIVKHSGGRLDALVLSHRHKDHMSGFGSKTTVKLLDPIRPGLVVQPWTEHPQAKARATGARKTFLQALDAGEELLGRVVEGMDERARGLRGEVRSFAAAQLTNKDAVKQLARWAKAGDAEYLSVGDTSKLQALLPGVRVTVLGPPTIDQAPGIMRYRDDDPEYWLRVAAAGVTRASVPPAGLEPSSDEGERALTQRLLEQPGQVRWLVERLNRQSLFQLRRIVRTMDDALNNTSLILLFEFGDRAMLFCGDAQIENWEYTLKQHAEDAAFRQRLRHVDLYKVGHHGSRNATPKHRLYDVWAAEPRLRHLTSVVSTKEEVHGESGGTEVPRVLLLQALGRIGTVVSTHQLDPAQAYVELEAPAAGGDYVQVQLA